LEELVEIRRVSFVDEFDCLPESVAGAGSYLMSLGAIDFGLVVDGSVVMIENIVRKLGEKAKESSGNPMAVIVEAEREVARPVFFASAIIIIVYLPILSLQGVEGKMFKPMALTVVFALSAALILSLTLMPVLASLFFRKGVKEHEPWLMRKAKGIYLPVLRTAVAQPRVTVVSAAVVFLVSVLLTFRMGAEFIPPNGRTGRVASGRARSTGEDAGYDHGPIGRGAGFSAHGPFNQCRRRSAASTGNCRDRRLDHFHSSHLIGASKCVPLV